MPPLLPSCLSCLPFTRSIPQHLLVNKKYSLLYFFRCSLASCFTIFQTRFCSPKIFAWPIFTVTPLHTYSQDTQACTTSLTLAAWFRLPTPPLRVPHISLMMPSQSTTKAAGVEKQTEPAIDGISFCSFRAVSSLQIPTRRVSWTLRE